MRERDDAGALPFGIDVDDAVRREAAGEADGRVIAKFSHVAMRRDTGACAAAPPPFGKLVVETVLTYYLL